MKLFTKVLIVVLLLGLAGPFFLKGPDGRPWMRVSDIMPQVSQWPQQWQRFWSSTKEGAERISDEPLDWTELSDLGETKIYRWRDEQGNLVYSDEPRADGRYEIVVMGENQTVVPATKPVQIEVPSINETAQGSGITVPLPLTASPQEISQLMEGAQEVRQQMETRTQAIESAVEGSK